MSTPLVSIIIPCYNAAKYLNECLDSMVSQTYRNLEIITLDDGSVDDTFEMLSQWQRKDDRIRVVRNPVNLKLIETLNKGIEMSQGVYIARMDADDIAMPTRIEEQVRIMENRKEIGIVGTFIDPFDEQGGKGKLVAPVTHSRIRAYSLIASPFFHPSVLIRKSLLDEYCLRYEKEYYRAEDHAFWINILEHTKGINLNQPLLKYRILMTSETRMAEKNHVERQAILQKVYKLALTKINLQLNEDEMFLYSCSMTRKNMELISHYSIRDLLVLYYKVLRAGQIAGLSAFHLKRYLGLRVIAFLMLTGKYKRISEWRRVLQSSLLYYGITTFVFKKYTI